ncbi:MAG: S8 family peptidase [Bacteriovoracaceae bacterium]
MILLSLILNIAFAQVSSEMIAIPNKGCPKAIGEFVFSKSERAFLKKYSPEIACSQKVNTKVKSALYHFEKNALLDFHSLSDPYVEEQWGLRNLGLPQPFIVDDITTINTPGMVGEDLAVEKFNNLNLNGDKKDIIVAVLDTGIDLTHPEFVNQVYTKKSECDAFAEYKKCLKTSTVKLCDQKWAAIDTDNNGYPMDCNGWNVTGKINPLTKIMGDSDVQDKIGHGTHVSGIIAAAVNGQGVEGIAPHAKILPIKVLSSAPSSPERPLSLTVPGTKESDLPKIKTYGDIFARGLLYAIRSGANVVNMSLGWPYAVDSDLMRTLVKIALEKNIILVSSAGNDSTSVPLFPCYYTGVICVASHGADGAFSTFSNYGSNVDVVAPGSRILSTYPMSIRPSMFNEMNGYEFDQGTSMSSPYVAGVVARLLAANIPEEDIYPRLISGARETKDSVNAKLRLYEKYTLSGNVDLYKSFKVDPRPVILPAEKGQKLKAVSLLTDLSFKIKLKNFWKSTANVSVTVTPKAGLTSSTVGLPPAIQTFATWDRDEVKVIDVPATLTSAMAHSDLEFVVRVTSSDGFLINEFIYQLELVTDLNAHPYLASLPVDNQTVLDTTGARLRSLDSGEFLLLKDETDEDDKGDSIDVTRLALMKKTDGKYQIVKSGVMTKVEGELQDIHNVGANLIFVVKSKNENGKAQLSFITVDGNLKEIRKVVADSEKAPLSTDIIWVKNGSQIDPLWIAFGEKLEKPKFDPWNPNPEKEQGIWFYTADEKGIHNLNYDLGDKFLVAILPQTNTEAAQGVIRLLLAKGDKYDFLFSVAQVLDGKLVKEEALNFTKYHMLGGLVGTSFKTKNASGVFFGTETLITEIRDGKPTTIKQSKIKPVNNLLQIQQVHGVFHTSLYDGAFSQTQNELQYHDFRSGKVSYISLKRFSFMPNYFFDKFFFPMTIGNLPAIYVPSGLGTSFTSDMVVPKTDGSGKVSLIRPALWRILSKGECLELNPTEEAGISKLRYFCGSKVLEISLVQP